MCVQQSAALHVCILSFLSFFTVQFTENLQVMFDQEGWTLDTTVTLKSNLDILPYEKVFKAVSNKYTSKCYLLTYLAGVIGFSQGYDKPITYSKLVNIMHGVYTSQLI